MALISAHMSCSLLSYIAFLISFVSGILFLAQERQLKRKTLGVLFHRLPSLEVLDRVNFLAIGIGFALLSVGMACGFMGAEKILGHWWTGDPKEYLTLTLWFSYFILWIIRLRATLRGRRVALLSVLGFSFVIFSLFGASWLLSSGHPYI